MTAIIMVMWLWAAQIKFCHQVHQPAAGLAPMTGTGDPLPGITVTPAAHVMNTEIDLGSAALNPNSTTTAIGAAATMIHKGVNQDHSTGLLATISHVIEAPSSHHCCCDTPHCRHSTSRHVSRDDSRSSHRS